MREIIRYEQVDISYYEKRVVRDISFALQPGEILGKVPFSLIVKGNKVIHCIE